MKTQAIQNQPNFNGYVSASGLSRKQIKIYESIQDALKAKVAGIDYLILNINGSSHPCALARTSKDPQYVIMHTQVKSATIPTAESQTNSLNPKDWLNMADELIKKHQNSDFYKRTVETPAISPLTRIKNLFKKILHIH